MLSQQDAILLAFQVLALPALAIFAAGIFYGLLKVSRIKGEIRRSEKRFSKGLGVREIGKQFLVKGDEQVKKALLTEFAHAMSQKNLPDVRLVKGEFVDEEMHTSHEAVYVDTIIGKTLVTFSVVILGYGSRDLQYSWLRFTRRRTDVSTLNIIWRWGLILGIVIIYFLSLFLPFLILFEIGIYIVAMRDSEVRTNRSVKRYSKEALQVAISRLATTVDDAFMEAIDKVGISSEAVREIEVSPVPGKFIEFYG